MAKHAPLYTPARLNELPMLSVHLTLTTPGCNGFAASRARLQNLGRRSAVRSVVLNFGRVGNVCME